MARDYPPEKQELSRARGFMPISAEQGLNSFLAGLHRDQVHLLVGLDATKAHIGRHVEQPTEETRILRAYLTTRNGRVPAASPDGHEEEVRDRFGTPSACELVRVPELPLTGEGTIDRTRLAEELGQHAPAEQQAAPQTETERTVARIWQELLGVPQLGIHDNFFDLGGYSLLATRIVSRTSDAFGIELPMRSLFEAPTISQFARVVDVRRETGSSAAKPTVGFEEVEEGRV